jgi:hypothetical protein
MFRHDAIVPIAFIQSRKTEVQNLVFNFWNIQNICGVIFPSIHEDFLMGWGSDGSLL